MVDENQVICCDEGEVQPLKCQKIVVTLELYSFSLPNGLTQKHCGLTGSRNVMCPETPSENPNLAKTRNAIASRCFRYFRSSYLSLKIGGPVGTSDGRHRFGLPLEYSLSDPDAPGGFSVADGAILFLGEKKLL
jgi:hypothetical protein